MPLPLAFSPAEPGNPGYQRLRTFFQGKAAWEWEAWAREKGLIFRAVRG